MRVTDELACLSHWELRHSDQWVIMSAGMLDLIELDARSFDGRAATFLSRVHPADRDRLHHAQRDAMEHRRPYEIEYRLQLPAAGLRWVQEHAYTEYDPEGRPERTHGIVRDITESRRTQDAVRQSEARLRLALQAANQGLYDLNVQTGEAVVSPEYATMLGYDPATFEETNARWLARLHPEDHAATAQAFAEYLAGQRTEYRVECRQRTADGAWRWILSLGRVVERDAQGRPLRLVGTHTDITELKNLAASLQRNEAWFRLVLEALPIPLAIALRSGQIEYLNPKFVELFGYTREDVRDLGAWFERAYPDPNYREDVRRRWEASMQATTDALGFTVPVETELTCKNGDHRFIQVLGATLGDRVLAMFTDLTARRHAETALRDSEQRFRAVVENAQAIIFMLDAQGTFQLSEGRALARLGLRPGEVVGQSAFTLYQDVPSVVAGIRRALQGHAVRTINELPQGVFDTTYSPYYAPDGRQDGVVGIAVDVTDRYRAEAAARENQERLALALQGADLGSWDWNVATGTLSFNERWARMLGYAPETLAPHYRTWERLVHPDDLPNVLQVLRDHIQGRTPVYETEHRMRHQAGHWVWVLDRGKVISRDASGLPLRAVGTHLDITERKCAEAELQRTVSMLQATLQSTADGILVVDRQGAITGHNHQFCSLWGLSEDFLAQRNDAGALDQVRRQLKDPEGFIARVETIYASPETDSFDVLEFADGRVFERLSRPQWIAGRPVGRVWSFRDVTARKQAELSLEMFRFTVEQASDQIVWLNQEAGFQYVNEQACRMLGYTRDELMTLHLWDIDPFFPRDRWRSDWASFQLDRRGGTVLVESTQRRKNGELFPVDVCSRHLWFGDRELHVAIVRDITERKRAEAERERLIAELEAKNAELERFTYTVSHDLKSPLITIKAFAGALHKDLTAGRHGRMIPDLQRISDATDKMAALLSDLLALSRVGRLVNPPTEVSLQTLAVEVSELMNGLIQAHRVEICLAPHLPTVQGDRTRLGEVLQNLLENAIRFMGAQPHPRVELDARRDGGEWVVWVRDNGQGIDPRYHETVFGLFNKLDANTEGNGLGLALVRRIVEVHGGRVWVESPGPGQGSTFFFTLPAPTPPPQEPP